MNKKRFKNLFMEELISRRNGLIFELAVTLIGCAIAAHSQCKELEKMEKEVED